MLTRPDNNINEVTHETVIEDSVPKVTADTGSKEPKSNVSQSAPGWCEKKYPQNSYQCNDRDSY